MFEEKKKGGRRGALCWRELREAFEARWLMRSLRVSSGERVKSGGAGGFFFLPPPPPSIRTLIPVEQGHSRGGRDGTNAGRRQWLLCLRSAGREQTGTAADQYRLTFNQRTRTLSEPSEETPPLSHGAVTPRPGAPVMKSKLKNSFSLSLSPLPPSLHR